MTLLLAFIIIALAAFDAIDTAKVIALLGPEAEMNPFVRMLMKRAGVTVALWGGVFCISLAGVLVCVILHLPLLLAFIAGARVMLFSFQVSRRVRLGF